MDWIDKIVYERYPKTEKEFTCWQERLRLNGLRQALRNKIEQEEIHTIAPKQDELLRKEVQPANG